MARRQQSKKPTWQEYLRRTAVMRAAGTDAAFGNRPLTTATRLRWAGQDRLLFGSRIINGKYTGRLITSLELPQLQQLLRTATHQADRDTLERHIMMIGNKLGPQPGAPVDPETAHAGGTIQAEGSSRSILTNMTCRDPDVSETSTKG